MRNLVLFTSMILSFWGCSSDKDFGGLENIGWNEKPLQITTRILTTKSTNFIQEFKEATDNYLLGFEDIEDYYYEKEQEMLDELYLFLYNEYVESERICTNRDNFIEFLRENFMNECSYNVMPTMVDYSPSDVENLLIENHLITSY